MIDYKKKYLKYKIKYLNLKKLKNHEGGGPIVLAARAARGALKFGKVVRSVNKAKNLFSSEEDY